MDWVDVGEMIPEVIAEVRYYSAYNFVGQRIDGYQAPRILLTQPAAKALQKVCAEAVSLGYYLKLYDGYRPQRAVNHFVRWAQDGKDTRMKQAFYPDKEKSVLFREGFIAEKSGHSRGSTIDLTLFDAAQGRDVDMGCPFDTFAEKAHPDYAGDLTDAQRANRRLLSRLMTSHGFRPLETEWWHFTLNDEPFPDTYFDFSIT